MSALAFLRPLHRILHWSALGALAAGAALSGPPARAQTCAGALEVPLEWESIGAAGPLRVPVAWQVQATRVTPGGTRGRRRAEAMLPLDSMAAHPERYRMEVDDTIRDTAMPRVLAFRTECGFAMLRLAFSWDSDGGLQTFILDVYNVPPHTPMRLDAPLVLRAGHARLDLGGSDGLRLMESGDEPRRLIPHGWIETLQ